MTSDGTGAQRLTQQPGEDGYGSWSPDGSRIAFVSDLSGDYEIYTMNRDGTQQQRVFASSADEWRVDRYSATSGVERSSEV